MNQTTFYALKNNQDNQAWQTLFNRHWPAYKQWFESKKQHTINAKELKLAQQKLKHIMPELWPIYSQLCEFTGDDPVARQFLTLYQPPAFLINCSQAIFFDQEPMLIRNYDLSPDLSENTILFSNWQGRKIITTNECLWGADDGMNDAGLAISLTFGGSKDVGAGFGIPIIMRYVLQTCETVKQALEQLKRIPSHMAYNISLVDKTGDFATVFLAANQTAVVTKSRITTNHQQSVVWPEQARFSKTVERENHLQQLFSKGKINQHALVKEFHRAPLYSNNFRENFGTVYTALYKPASGEMAYHWPDESWHHSFNRFNDTEKPVQLGGESVTINPTPQWEDSEFAPSQYIPVDIQAQFDGIFFILARKPGKE